MFTASVQGCFVPHGAGAAPATPTLSLTRLSSTSFRATIGNVSDGITARLYHRITTVASWTTVTRSGSGTIDVTDVSEGATVLAIVVADDSEELSAPSELATVALTAGADSSSGMLSRPMALLQTLIANCAAFQTWTGTVDADEAASRIYLVQEPEASVEYPFACIYQGENSLSVADRGGSRNFFSDSGDLGIFFTAEVSAEDSDREAELVFGNAIGLILDDAKVLSGSGGYLDAHEFTRAWGPGIVDQDESADGVRRYEVGYQVAWGGER